MQARRLLFYYTRFSSNLPFLPPVWVGHKAIHSKLAWACLPMLLSHRGTSQTPRGLLAWAHCHFTTIIQLADQSWLSVTWFCELAVWIPHHLHIYIFAHIVWVLPSLYLMEKFYFAVISSIIEDNKQWGFTVIHGAFSKLEGFFYDGDIAWLGLNLA